MQPNSSERNKTRGLERMFDFQGNYRIAIFNVLAIAGIIVYTSMMFVGYIGNSTPMVITLNMYCILMACIFLYFVNTRKNYKPYCIIIILIIFVIIFPIMFFLSNGYDGGVPTLFIFAILFTIFMLDGKSVIVLMSVEFAVYISCMILAYYYPELVTYTGDATSIFFDKFTSFFMVTFMLAIIMWLFILIYNRQNDDLKLANFNASAANRAKSSFIANMSHEIRTPIHIILSVNEMITRDSYSDKIKEHSKKINDAGEMLRSLVDNILDVSKIEAGKTEIINEAYKSESLIDSVILTGETWSQRKNLKFIVNVNEGIPSTLKGDIVHIRQVANNILSNAVKYTEVGQIVLSIYVEDSIRKNEVILCIRVQDTGIGIKEEDMPVLFDVFSRVNLSTGRYIEGTGLGLSIAKELMELMGGDISVESEFRKGSVFTIKLPQTIIEEQIEDYEVAKKSTFVAPEGKILVVDDNEENLKAICLLLERTSLKIDTALSGREALALCNKNDYHVILLDYMMPDMDGLETLRELIKIKDFRTPMVAITANAVSNTERYLLNHGFRAYISKPIRWQVLEKILIKYLPSDLITILDVKETNSISKETIELYRKKLVDINVALDYFSGDVEHYVNRIKLFIDFYPTEIQDFNDVLSNFDYNSLKFLTHSLKAKSKNIGLLSLAEACQNAEDLCTREQFEEVKAYMPYIFHLWTKGIEAIKKLYNDLSKQDDSNDKQASSNDKTQILNELPAMLKELRRKPALDNLKIIIDNEEDETKKQLLIDIYAEINFVRFEKACELLEEYNKIN